MGGGSRQPTTTTQISKTELPKWVEAASEQNYNYAKTIADRPYVPYTGQTVAGFTPDTTNAFNMYRQNAGKTGQQIGQAARGINGLIDYRAPTVSSEDVDPALLAGRDMSPYINPWIDNVENRAMANLERSRKVAINDNASRAAAAKSFGGSRHAIIDAVTNSETAREAGDLSAGLRKAGFDTAMGLMASDVDRENQIAVGNRNASLQAGLANQQAGLAGAGIRLQAGDQAVGAAQAQQEANLTDYAGLLDIGQRSQQMDQMKLDDAYGRFREAQDYPLEQLNIRLAALGMSPYGRTDATTKSGTVGSRGFDWATGLLGAGQLAMGLFSEDEAKTDIEKVGTDPESGLGIFAYRYKNDPKTYPKVVGVMASDVEEKMPKAVRRVGKGKKARRVIDFRGAA